MKLKNILRTAALTFLAFLILLLSEKYINATVVSFWSNLDYAQELSKSIYVLLVILASIYLSLRIKIFNGKMFFKSVCVVIIYSFYRFNLIEHIGWNYAELSGSINYADAMFLLPVIISTPLLRKVIFLEKKLTITVTSKQKRNTDNNTSTLDQPISIKEHDLFGYYEDAEKLAEKIILSRNQTRDNALVIGLQGKWGQGKTSYLNMFKIAVGKNALVVRFNPWLNHNYNQLSRNFLGAISEAIDDLTIKNSINDYAQRISDANIGRLSSIANIFSVKPKEYADELFDKVSNYISKLDKLLIIQVDDIDRLTGEEILNTIKLIRNIANFKNTVFIIAYDEEYVVSALNQIHIKKEYLEKIFNVPYSLPAIRSNSLKTVICNRIKSILLLTKDNTYEASMVDKFVDIVEANISLRNSIRLGNEVMSNWSNLLDEERVLKVDLLDYLLISYLRMINLKAYDYLARFSTGKGYISAAYIDQELITENGRTLTLNMTKSLFEFNEKYNDIEYKEKRLALVVGEENLSLVYDILNELFSERKGICRISYLSSYSIFFERKLDHEIVYKREFDSALNAGSQEFKLKLVEWSDSHDLYSLSRLISSVRLKSEEEWIRSFYDVLEISPISYIKWIFQRNQLIPQLGVDLLDSSDNSIEERQTYAKALLKFLFNPELLTGDSLEIIQKKICLYLYLTPSPINIVGHLVPYKLSSKDIFMLYWNRYDEFKTNYSDFNEDFWHMLKDIYYQEKLDVIAILKDHIKANFSSFITNYPVDEIIHRDMRELFGTYTSEGHGNTAWKGNFISFLNEIYTKTPNPKLREYIDHLESQLHV